MATAITPTAGLAAYAFVLFAMLVTAGAAARSAYTSLATVLGSSVLTEPVDAVSDRKQATLAAREQGHEAYIIAPDTTEFVHARPAPRLFENADSDEVERLKSDVSERVYAEGSRDWYNGRGHTYTTVCVRLCDGAYFPVSYSTTRKRFAHDEAVCKSRCAAPARLFVRPNPGGSVETMVDLSGHSYLALPTANQFRRGLTAGCACRAEAWEEAAQVRHRSYAAVDLGAKGNVAVGEAQQAVQPARSRMAALENVTTARDLGQTGSLPSSLTTPVTTPARSAPQQPAVLGWKAMQTAALQPAEKSIDAVANVVTETITTTFEVSPVDQSSHASLLIETVRIKPLKQRRARINRKRAAVASSEFDGDVRGLVSPVNAGGKTRRGAVMEEIRIWGAGPNSVSAPVGSTARDIFARNFF